MNKPEEICPRCFIGVLRFDLQAYTLVWQQQIITIPDAPCYTCDICGYREYEDDLVNWVHELIGTTPNDSDDPRPRNQPKSHHKA